MTTTRDRAAHAAALDAARGPRWRRVLRALGSVVGALVAFVVLAVVVLLVVVPRVKGGTTLTVLTGSMEPAFAPGDVIAVAGIDPADACEAVRIGDVISFLPYPDDPTLISHRVIGKGSAPADWKEQGYGAPCTFTTQGDANSAADETVQPKQVRGVLLYVVPRLGWLRQYAGDHADTLVWVVIGVLLVIALVSWLRPRRRVIRVAIPVDPRVTAAGEVLDAWRGDPYDPAVLRGALDHLAEVFEAPESAETPQAVSATAPRRVLEGASGSPARIGRELR